MAGYYIPLVATPQIGDNGGGGGGGSGVLVVNVTTASNGKTQVCDKTAGEMAAALENGGLIFRVGLNGAYVYQPLASATIADGETYSFAAGETVFTATSASDYPAYGVGPK